MSQTLDYENSFSENSWSCSFSICILKDDFSPASSFLNETEDVLEKELCSLELELELEADIADAKLKKRSENARLTLPRNVIFCLSCWKYANRLGQHS